MMPGEISSFGADVPEFCDGLARLTIVQVTAVVRLAVVLSF